MTLSKLFVYFIIFSFMGWVYESIYCTIDNKSWQNRGFLFGPICPIYGLGGVGCAVVCGGMFTGKLVWWQVFLVCYVGSIFLEYGTHFLLEKLFHAVWWDYSDKFLNIKGRVCFGASCGFGLAGIIVSNFIYPFTASITNWMPAVLTEALALFLMAVLGADIALTVSALTSLMQNVQAIETKVNTQMEEFYRGIESNVKNAAEKREELTASATETMSMLMNLGQKHALSSVKEFRYGGTKNSISDRLVKLQKGIVKGAVMVKENATEKAVEFKENATEKAMDIKEAASEKMGGFKDAVAEKLGKDDAKDEKDE